MKFEGSLPSLPNNVIQLNNTTSNGHWEFPEKMGPPYIGFVYVIYDTILNRAYIGKKVYLGTGQLNRGKETNWKKYTSSSKLLAELLRARPKEEFEFICMEQYMSKGTLSYSETWSICFVEAPTSKVFYNTLIEKVSWTVREPISERHKQRLVAILERTRNA